MKLLKYVMLSAIALSCFSCSDDDDSTLRNDLIKKTVAPAIAGEKIEFAYAMGAPSTATMMDKVDEHYMNPAVAFGTSQASLIAATVRYAYVVPAEAKGKNISFTFSSTSSTGAKASYSTPSYPVSKMDMKRLIELGNEGACYFSIEDMKAYTKEEVTTQSLASKIDFIYIYQAKLNGYDYKHSFVSPGTDPKYIAIAGIVPAEATNKTPMEKRANVRDAQLKGEAPNVYIDDVDFQSLDLGAAVDYALTFSKDDGAFMKTANGKYAAYVYVNKIDDSGKMTISIKRYPL